MTANGLKCVAMGVTAALMVELPCTGQVVQADTTVGLLTVKRQKRAVHQYPFYAGAQAAAQVFKITSTTYPIQEAVVRPLHVFVGYQLGPHLALQAGFMRYNRPSENNSFVHINQAGQPVTESSFRDQDDSVLPVLLRYNIAHQPMHRLHLDVLLGLTTVFHYYQADDATTIAGKIVYAAHNYSRTRNLFLAGGAGLGYRIVPHVDLMVEATANRNLSAPDYAAGARKINFGVGAGLRYHFDLSRSASQSLVR